MDTGGILPLYNTLREDEQVFLFSGLFHDDHTARLIALAEASQRGRSGDTNSGRLAFLMVEAYQNVIRHQAALPARLASGAGRSLFLLRSRSEGNNVITVNPMHKADRPNLERELSRLEGAEATELKRMFLEGLRIQHDGQRRGAGLGLIEMARRSGNALHHEVVALEQGWEMLTLSIGTGRTHGDHGLSAARALHQLAIASDLVLVYAGQATAEVQSSLMRMLESDVDPARGRDLGRAYLAAVTWMLARAGHDARTLLVVSRDGDHFHLRSGVVLEGHRAEEALQAAAQLRSLDRSELDRSYRRMLLDPSRKEGQADLLDLARVSVEPVEVSAIPLEAGRLLVIGAVV